MEPETRRTLHGCTEHPELDELLRKSAEAYKAMTPEQKAHMNAAQRRSWVIGEMMLDHPEMTRDEALAIYEGL